MNLKKAGVIYTGRLGDIVLTLPLSKHLSSNYEVIHYCHREYADIFKAVSYVNPRIVDESDRAKCYYIAKKLASKECEIIYDRQIWPSLYDNYRKSQKRWMDFYYDGFKFVDEKKPLFDIDYDVSEYVDDNTVIISCHAYSDGMGIDWNWVKSVMKSLSKSTSISKYVYVCAKNEKAPLEIQHLQGLPLYLLPSLLKKSKLLITRNSSLACMAIGTGTPTFHIKAYNFTDQDTHVANNLVGIKHKDNPDKTIEKLIKLCR